MVKTNLWVHLGANVVLSGLHRYPSCYINNHTFNVYLTSLLYDRDIIILGESNMKKFKILLAGLAFVFAASSATAQSNVHFGSVKQGLLTSNLKSVVVPFSIVNHTEYTVDVTVDERPHGDVYHVTLSPYWDNYYSQWSDDDPYWNVEVTIHVNGAVYHRVVNSAQHTLYIDPGYGNGVPVLRDEGQ